MSAFDPKTDIAPPLAADCRLPLGDWSWRPIVAGQRCYFDVLDHAESQGWIEIVHCLFTEVDNATGLERPDIIYFDDGLLVAVLDQGIAGSASLTNPAKLLTQSSLNRSGPSGWIIALA